MHVRVIIAECLQCLGQVQHVVAIAATGSMRGVDVLGQLRHRCGSQKRVVVLVGNVNHAGHGTRLVEQVDAGAETLVAILLAVIEVLEHGVIDPIGNAKAGRARCRHQRHYPAGRFRCPPMIVRALPEAPLPAADAGQFALQEGKVDLVDK